MVTNLYFDQLIPVSRWYTTWLKLRDIFICITFSPSSIPNCTVVCTRKGLSTLASSQRPSCSGPLLSNALLDYFALLTISSVAFLWLNLSPNTGHSEGRSTVSLQKLANAEGFWTQHRGMIGTIPFHSKNSKATLRAVFWCVIMRKCIFKADGIHAQK